MVPSAQPSGTGAAHGAPPASRTLAALDLPLHQVRDPDEAGHERLRGLLVDLLRRAALLDHAGVHDRDAVGHRERLLLVVRDVEERDADLALDRLELHLHLLAQLEVERAERLVEQQHGGPVDERAGERDALALAARELVRLRRLAPGQPHQLERLGHARADLVRRHLAALEPERDVALDVEVLEQRVALEHRVDVALERRHASRPARRRGRPRPSVGCSKPATIRSVVVLPQPDGPSSEKNSPALDRQVERRRPRSRRRTAWSRPRSGPPRSCRLPPHQDPEPALAPPEQPR